MMALSAVDYIHELRQAGVSDQVSEIHARRLAQAITEIKQEVKQEVKQEFRPDALATKGDLERLGLETKNNIEKLRLEIQQVRYDALKFTVWTGVGVVVMLGGMLAKGFHWF